MKKKTFLTCTLVVGGLLAFLPASGQAQERVVKLATSKAVGSDITLLVNSTNKGVTVDWGNGMVQTYAGGEDVLLEITGQKAGDTITITGGRSWVMLACPGMGLTAVDLSAATGMQSLYLQNNELAAIDLRGMTSLTDLNLANNKLASITYTDAGFPEKDLVAMEHLNLGGNELTGQFILRENNVSVPKHLQSVNISNNKFTSAVFTSNTALDMLKCDGNDLTKLDLNYNRSLSAFMGNGNKLATISYQPTATGMQQFIADDNKLKSALDFSNCSKMKDISIANNQISELTMPEVKMSSLNYSGNALTFASLPVKAPTYVSFVPQEPVDISGIENMKTSADGVSYVDAVVWEDRKTNPIDLNYLTFVGVSEGDKGVTEGVISVYSIAADGTETELAKGSVASAPKDYYALQNQFAFFTPQEKVYARIDAQRAYRAFDVYVKTSAFAVGEDMATGIEDGMTVDKTLAIIPVRGGLQIQNGSSARALTIYGADGKTVWSGTVGSGTTTVNLPSGIYVVNREKFAI